MVHFVVLTEDVHPNSAAGFQKRLMGVGGSRRGMTSILRVPILGYRAC